MKSFLANLWRSLKFSSFIQLKIMRFISDEFLVGVTGIIFNKNEKVLIVKHTYRKIEWSLPGGYLKAKEHPTEGLEREIEEETGFIVAVDKLLKVRTDRKTGRLDFTYTGTYIGGDFKKNEEVIDYKFCSQEDLPILLTDQVLLISEALTKRKIKSSSKEYWFSKFINRN